MTREPLARIVTSPGKFYAPLLINRSCPTAISPPSSRLRNDRAIVWRACPSTTGSRYFCPVSRFKSRFVAFRFVFAESENRISNTLLLVYYSDSRGKCVHVQLYNLRDSPFESFQPPYHNVRRFYAQLFVKRAPSASKPSKIIDRITFCVYNHYNTTSLYAQCFGVRICPCTLFIRSVYFIAIPREHSYCVPFE